MHYREVKSAYDVSGRAPLVDRDSGHQLLKETELDITA
jgi:hypothetical protein